MYQNQFPNLYQFQYPNNVPTNNQLIRVTGLDGAKAYQMSSNSTVALFDSGSDVMFIKSTDGAGFPTIRTFRFEEIHENVTTSNVEYVSKDEFEEFKKEILNNAKQFVSKPGKPNKQTINVVEYDE